MDGVLNFLSNYGYALNYADLSDSLVHQVKRRMIDTLGCAMGCYDMEPPRMARAHALEAVSTPGSTVLGTRHKTTPELAAFANGVMVRYLDFNDTSMSGNAGHPSDNIPAVLAAAEYAGATVQTAIAGIVIAYEVQGRFGDACKDLRARGWDSAIFVGVSAAAGAAKALGLNKDQTAYALALAAVPYAAMGQTRVGHLSMWKGCTAPNSARNGTFAALLARRGMTGPLEAFDGTRGFKKQLGTTLKLAAFGGAGVPYTIETDKFKYYPCDYEAQCAFTPILELHAALHGNIDDIDKVEIETYDHAIKISADTPDKWSPQNRETADHSIPYVAAVGLARGKLWLEDFEEERIREPRIHALMQKIQVRATDACNRDWPEAYPFRITVTTKSGHQHLREIRYAKGHPKNPMSDKDIEAKFLRLTEPVMGQDRARNALDRLWHLDEMKTVNEILEPFALDQTRNL